MPEGDQPAPPSSSEETGRRRVVILGGGVAGMTAAMELSQGDWRKKYESITVYQYGWRLGGKGASGRGGPHERIEEHGLHIWLGFYENAFRMLRECYEELGRPASSPIPSVDEAFEPASLFIVQEPRGDSWLPWFAEFPETEEMPGERTTPLPSLWEVIVHGLRLARAYEKDAKLTAADLSHAPGVSLRPPPMTDLPPVSLAPVPASPVRSLLSCARELYLKLWSLVSDVRQTELAAAVLFAEHLPVDVGEHDPAHHSFLVGLVDRAVDRLRQVREHPDELSDQARREWYLADVMLAAIRGVLADGVLHHPDGLDSIDHYDFAEWLIRHGASPESANCGMVTTLMYDLPFAYQDGEPTKPAIGAGTALRGAVRTLFTYTGAIAWKMRAGMGDIVFAPMFEVLERRGVRFEFFHRVEALKPSDDGGRVASITLSRQAKLHEPHKPDARYRPLKDVNGLPCWPNAPLNDQLESPLSAEDGESFWSTRPPEGPPVVLHDGVEFDTVVLAIPVGAHPYICGELLALNPRWQAMVENLGTIYTQAFQLWLSAEMHELGCDWPPATTGGYLEPFDTYADMRQLIERELWPVGEVGSIAYFCNVMPTPPGLPSRDDRQLPERAAREVKANALTFLREAMAPLWPGGVHRYPTEFRWDLLVDHEDLSGAAGTNRKRTGPTRFDSQFWRANVDPSERYVLSLPGTSQYRLDTDDTGFENLFFAGDWTRCSLNSGCVEAAVISGLTAAGAIDAGPAQREIIGSREQGAPHVF